MLQNSVGNGIGNVTSPLTLLRIRFVNLAIFWKQDKNTSSIFKD